MRRLVLALLLAAPPAVAREGGVTVLVGGDVLLGRGVLPDGAPVDARLLGRLEAERRGADLVIVGLESPFGACLPGGTVSHPRLCARPGAEAVLVAGAVDAANLANNHALDAGRRGLAETRRILHRAGVTPIGVVSGTPAAERLGDLRIVAASIAPAAHPPASRVRVPAPERVARVVRRARRAAPRLPVLVLLHTAREGDARPSARDQRYAEAAVDAGAAAVVMSGAHVVRPLALIRGVPVHFGLGNLLFDQRDPKSRTGALLRLRLERGRPATVLDVSEVTATVQPETAAPTSPAPTP